MRPEETEYALRYLTDIDPKDEEQQAILKYARSASAIYDYQLYQILRWFFDRQNFAIGLLAQCRSLAFDRNRSPWIRSYAIAILGKAGDPSDLEHIEASYAIAVSEVERAEIARALSKMEVGRRNAFFKRVVGDGFLIAAAVNQARCNI